MRSAYSLEIIWVKILLPVSSGVEIERYQKADKTKAEDYLKNLQSREVLEKKIARTHGIQKLSVQEEIKNLDKKIYEFVNSTNNLLNLND